MAVPSNSMPVLRAVVGGVVLRVRLTPRSSSEQIGELVDTGQGQAVAIHVRAVPTDGEANAAVSALLAKALGLPKGAVSLVSGHKSRIKTMLVSGDTAAMMELIGRRLLIDDQPPVRGTNGRGP